MKILGTTTSEKRRDKRSSGRPLGVELDGERYRVEECSLSGLRIAGYSGDREPGDRVDIVVFFGDEDDSVSRRMRIEIVRVNDGAEALAARFVDLDDTAYDMLEAWLSGARRRVMQLGGRDV